MHGSLTKAGKVRKQTPKVETQVPLKKVPVGRAKKREQYQKRYNFVTEGKEWVKFKPNKQANK